MNEIKSILSFFCTVLFCSVVISHSNVFLKCESTETQNTNVPESTFISDDDVITIKYNMDETRASTGDIIKKSTETNLARPVQTYILNSTTKSVISTETCKTTWFESLKRFIFL